MWGPWARLLRSCGCHLERHPNIAEDVEEYYHYKWPCTGKRACFVANFWISLFILLDFFALLFIGWIGFNAASTLPVPWEDQLYVVKTAYFHIGLRGYYLVGASNKHFMGHGDLDLTVTSIYHQSVPVTFSTDINWSFGWLAAIMSCIVTSFLLSCLIPRFGLWCFVEGGYFDTKCKWSICCPCRFFCKMETSYLKLYIYQTFGSLFALVAIGFTPFNGKNIKSARIAFLNGPAKALGNEPPDPNPLLDRMIYKVLMPLTAIFYVAISLRIRRHNAHESAVLHRDFRPEETESTLACIRRKTRRVTVNQFVCCLLCRRREPHREDEEQIGGKNGRGRSPGGQRSTKSIRASSAKGPPKQAASSSSWMKGGWADNLRSINKSKWISGPIEAIGPITIDSLISELSPLSETTSVTLKTDLSELNDREDLIVRYAALLTLSPFLDRITHGRGRTTFLKSIQNPQYDSKNNKGQTPGPHEIFGVDLGTIIRREEPANWRPRWDQSVTKDLQIPQFLAHLLDTMFLKDLREEGVLRKSGNTKLKTRTKENSKESGDIDWKNESTVQLAILLKDFFREMPNPLLTFALYRVYLTAYTVDEQDQKSRLLQLITCMLPKANRDTFEALVQFCEYFIRFEKTGEGEGNLMDSFNTASVVAPNILRLQNIMPDPAKDKLANDVIMTMIDEAHNMFQIPTEFRSLLADEQLLSISHKKLWPEMRRRYKRPS